MTLSGLHGLFEVAGVEIHEPITDIGEVSIDPDVLKFKAAIARAHKDKEVGNLVAAFDVDDPLFPSLAHLGLEMAILHLIEKMHEPSRVLLIPYRNLQMVVAARRRVDGTRRQKGADEVVRGHLIAFDHVDWYLAREIVDL